MISVIRDSKLFTFWVFETSFSEIFEKYEHLKYVDLKGDFLTSFCHRNVYELCKLKFQRLYNAH